MQFIVISSQLCYAKLKWNTCETSLLKLTLIALQVHHRFDWRFYEFKTESNIFCKGSLIPSPVQPKCPKLQNREHVFLNNWFFWAQWSFGPAEAQLALTKPPKTQRSSLFWTFLNSIHYLTKSITTPSIIITCTTLPQSITTRSTYNWRQYTCIIKSQGPFIKIHLCTTRYKDNWKETCNSTWNHPFPQW